MKTIFDRLIFAPFKLFYLLLFMCVACEQKESLGLENYGSLDGVGKDTYIDDLANIVGTALN